MFPNLPRGAHPEIKFWSSRLGLNMRLATLFWKNAHAEKPKKDAGIKRRKTTALDRTEWASIMRDAKVKLKELLCY
jgi:hypothetical protein